MLTRRVQLALVTAASLGLSVSVVAPATGGAQTSTSAAPTTSAAPSSSAVPTSSAAPTTTADASSKGSSSSNGSSSDKGTAKPSTSTSAAEATEGKLSPECQAEVDRLIAEHKKKVEDGTAGSSMIGPVELGYGIINGYGSSGMPDKPECALAKDEAEETSEPQLPDWAKSSELSPEGKEAFAWIHLIIGIATGVIQLAVVLATVNPSMLDALRNGLRAVGINPDK